MVAQRFFLLHVQRTAGTTLRQYILKNFEHDEVYPAIGVDADPSQGADALAAYFSLESLTSLPVSRRARIRVFTGHFPFMAVELLGGNLTTITILRDPVERTLSYLRLMRTVRTHRGLPLQEIYEDPFLFPRFIRDHQAKQFALTPEDKPMSFRHVLEVDATRLKKAKQNLERVDVIGTQDRFGELWSELEQRFGWRRPPVRSQNVSWRMQEVPASFRRRIAEDNAADMEFFEHALRLCEQRRRVNAVR